MSTKNHTKRSNALSQVNGAAQVPSTGQRQHLPAQAKSTQIADLSAICLENTPQLLNQWAKVAAQLGGGFTFSETITITEED